MRSRLPALWTNLQSKPHVHRYLVVGAVCTILQLALLQVLHQHLGAELANALAFMISTQVNFVLSYHWTWARRRTDGDPVPVLLRRAALFNMTALAGLLVNSGAFAGALHLLQMPVAAAALVGVGVSTTFSYVLGSRLTFAVGTTVLDDGVILDVAPARQSTVPRGVALFLPAYNEAENLPGVVGAAVTHLAQRSAPFAVIVVDDGSSDRTVDVCAELRERHPAVQVIRHPENLGYGAALRTGLQAAMRTRLPYVAFCDADGQFDPTDVQLLIDVADAGADLVIGYRIHRADSLKRRLMGRGWHRLGQVILGYRAKDIDCGFKLFRAEHLHLYVDRLSGQYATISPELLARATRAGARVRQVGLKHYPRQAGHQTGANLKVVFASLLELFALRRHLDQPTLVLDLDTDLPVTSEAHVVSETLQTRQELSA